MEQRTGLKQWTVLAALLLVLAACADGTVTDTTEAVTEEEQLQSVRLLIPFPEGLAWPGLMVAMDRYYEEEGLDVELIPVDGSSLVLSQLISGQEKFGVVVAADVLVANSRGAELRSVAPLDTDVFTIVTLVDSDIQTFEDLRGGSLGITSPSGGEAALVNAVLESSGFGDEVELVPVGDAGPASFDALDSGRVDAYAAGFPDLAGLQNLGMEFREILPEVFSSVPTDVLAATEETLANETDREIAIKLARGWLKGTVFTEANPEATLAIGCERVPEECTDMDGARSFLDAAVESVAIPEGTMPGTNEVAKWEVIKESLAFADLEGDVDVAEAAPDDFVDEVSDFDIAAVQAEARAAP